MPDPVPLRLRLPELLEEGGLSAYEFAKRARDAGHRVSARTVQRLASQRGRVAQFRGELLVALADVLGVGVGQLLEPDVTRKQRRGKPR